MLAALLIGCSSSGDAPTEFELPFGLEHVDGTEAIGRPAVFDAESYVFESQTIEIRSLWAVYRVSGENPGSVVLAWIEQLDDLAIHEIAVAASSRAGEPWLRAESTNPLIEDGPPPDVATLSLWHTDGDPILVVQIDRAGADPDPSALRITGDRGSLPAPPATLEDEKRESGDVLVTTERDKLLLPDGASTEVPTLPRSAGTGTLSIFTTDDASNAVEALLDSAASFGERPDVTGPDTSTIGGVEAVTASWLKGEGGWGFDVVAVQAPDDDRATVYVTTYED